MYLEYIETNGSLGADIWMKNGGVKVDGWGRKWVISWEGHLDPICAAFVGCSDRSLNGADPVEYIVAVWKSRDTAYLGHLKLCSSV